MNIGRTEGFASLNCLKGFSTMNVKARLGKGKKVYDPTKIVDDPTAVREGDFEYDFLPDSKRGLSVDWITHKSTYWLADIKILESIVDSLNVRYPANHPDKALQIIKGVDVSPTNYLDPFFQLITYDPTFSRKTSGGTYLMDLSDPIDRLYYYSYLYNPNTVVKDGRTISKYSIGKAIFELTLPEIEKKARIDDEDINIEAVSFLSRKNGISFEKQKIIAKMMGVKDVDLQNPNPDELRVALKIHAANNTSVSKKYGTTVQKHFIKLASMPNDELDLQNTLHKALEYNIIIRRKDNYEFENEIIEKDIKTEPQLIEYLKSKSHIDLYNKVLEKIEDIEHQLYGNKK